MVSDLTRRLRVAHIPCPAPALPSAPFSCSTCCCWDCQRLLRLLLLLLLLLLVLLHARLSSSAQAATVYIALFCLNGICTWKKIRVKNTKKNKMLPAKKQNAKKKWQRRNCEMGKENKANFIMLRPKGGSQSVEGDPRTRSI